MASEWSYKNQNYSTYRGKFQWIFDQEKQGKWNLVRVIRVRVIVFFLVRNSGKNRIVKLGHHAPIVM